MPSWQLRDKQLPRRLFLICDLNVGSRLPEVASAKIIPGLRRRDASFPSLFT
jgi:hypothetical protein